MILFRKGTHCFNSTLYWICVLKIMKKCFIMISFFKKTNDKYSPVMAEGEMVIAWVIAISNQ